MKGNLWKIKNDISFCWYCGKKFKLWKIWQKVKYQQMAETIRLPDGSIGTYEYKKVYHPNCAKKAGLI